MSYLRLLRRQALSRIALSTFLFGAAFAANRFPVPGTGFTNGGLLTAASPRAVVVADFNGDGNLDLAAVNFSAGASVTLLLNNGAGSFGSGASYPTGPFPGTLASGDLNGDGYPDLVVTNSQSANVSVFINRGDGTFLPAQNTPVGSAPYGVVVVDLNTDGKADLVVGNFDDGTLSVLIGNGNGTFQTPGTLTVGGHPEYIATADLNNDANADIVVVDGSAAGGLFVLLGNGNGAFQPMVAYTGLSQPRTVAIADLNNDGKLDLVTANQGSRNVSVFLGRGDGSFPSPVSSAAGPSALYSVAVSDFDGDGKADLVVADFDTGDASVLRGNGDGTVQSPINFPAAANPHSVAIGDFNGDGRADVAVGNLGDGDIRILLGTGGTSTYTFLSVTPSGSAVFGTPVTLQAAISTAGTGLPPTGTVTFYDRTTVIGSAPLVSGSARITTSSLAAGTRSLGAQYSGVVVYGSPGSSYNRSGFAGASFTVTAVPSAGFSKAFVPTGGDIAIALAVADINSDSKPDVVVTNRGGNNVALFQGAGNGTLSPAGTLTGFVSPAAVTVGDFDGDGQPDLAVANDTSSVIVLLGAGNFTFRAPRSYGVPPTPKAVLVGDFNGDGRPDLVVRSVYNRLSVLLGNGDGTFQPAINTVIDGGNYAGSLVVGDFNRDGVADIALAVEAKDQLAILLGWGDGTFRSAQTYSVQSMPESVTQGDFNGDGIVDLAVGNYFVATVSVFFGRGDGTFQPPATYPTGVSAHSMLSSDFNGDGKLDLAFAGWSNTVSVLLSNGDGTFGSPVAYTTTGEFPAMLAAGDFNGDGRVDLVTAGDHSGTGSPSPGDLGIYLGQSAGAAAIAATTGGGQSNPVGAAFSIPLQATLTDSGGNPVAGVSVTFTAPTTGPSGTWSGASTVTVVSDSAGHATAPVFTANGIAGSYAVIATAGSLTTTFPLTNTASVTLTPASLSFTWQSPGAPPAPQTLTISSITTITYSTSVSTANGVNWLSITPPSGTTNASHTVSVDPTGLTPGTYPGTITITYVGGSALVRVSLTVLGGATMAITSGDGQSAAINSPFATPLQVTITAGGVPVVGAKVTFTAPPLGASCNWGGATVSNVTTDASGRATASGTAPLQANSVTGTYNIAAISGSLSATFTLTNTNGSTGGGFGLIGPPVIGFNFGPGSSPGPRQITIDSSNGTSTPFTVSVVYPNPEASGWLTVAPSRLTTPAVLTLTANPSGYQPGRYLAMIVATPSSSTGSGTTQALILGPRNAANPAPGGSRATVAGVLSIKGTGGGGILQLQPQCSWMSSDTPVPNPASDEEKQLECSYARSANPSALNINATANSATGFSAALTFGDDSAGADWFSALYGGNALPATGTTGTFFSVAVQNNRLPTNKELAYISAVTTDKKGGDVAVIGVAAGPAVRPDTHVLEFKPTNGVFHPLNFTLNAAGAPFEFTLDASSMPWLTVSPSTGRLQAGGSQPITVMVNSNLPQGTNGGTIRIQLQRTDDATQPPTNDSISVTADTTLIGTTVTPPSIGSFSANPANIAAGGTSTLSWSVTGADSVTIDQGIGTVVATGTRAVSPTSNTTYTLTASNTAGNVTSTATVTVGAPPANRPVIGVGGVVTVAAGAQIMSPLSLVSIYGLNFTTGIPQTWDGATLRSTLAGVSVAIDGKPAFPLFVSPTFMNVQVPDTTTRGMVTVTVTNANGTSDPVSVLMADVAPEFKGWSPNPNQVEANRAGPSPAIAPACQAVACPVGPTAMLPPFSAPAQPGESISLWALGFGPSNPRIPAGAIGAAAPLVNQVQITIGGLEATLPYGGFLQGVGLYQFNVIVPPSLADGEYDVVATVNGVRTLKTMKLTVKR